MTTILVPVDGSALALEIDGRTWYFCGEWCRDRFAAAPERFASNAGATSFAAPP